MEANQQTVIEHINDATHKHQKILRFKKKSNNPDQRKNHHSIRITFVKPRHYAPTKRVDRAMCNENKNRVLIN